jgi:hypothetical protein
MPSNLIMSLAALAIVGLLITPFVLKIIKLGGISGVAFNAPILRTVGDVSRTDAKGTVVTFRVHALDESATGNAVGLEFITKGSSSYKSLTMSMPASVAKELAQLLEVAANERTVG